MTGRGTVNVSAKNMDIHKQTCCCQRGRFVLIDIQDSGKGIWAEPGRYSIPISQPRKRVVWDWQRHIPL
jgi:hypothetical protein